MSLRVIFLKVSLFFCFLIMGAPAYCQCCYYDVVPVLIDSRSVSDQSTDVYERRDCDVLKYCYSKQLLGMSVENKVDSMSYIFGLIVEELATRPSLDQDDLSIIFNYGWLLQQVGRYDRAKPILKYVARHPSSSGFLAIMSSIALNELGDMSLNDAADLERFSQLIENLSVKEKKIAILLAVINSDNYGDYALADQYYHLLNTGPIDNRHELLLALHFRHAFIKENDLRHAEIQNVNPKDYENYPGGKMIGNLGEADVADRVGDYEQMYQLLRDAVEIEYGSFDSVPQLIERIDKTNVPHFYPLSRFARASLYQTRVGKGLPPVKDAFNLYKATYSLGLTKKYWTLLDLVADPLFLYDYEYNNLLIVGNYLYQQTGDINYISEAIEVLDGYSGAGTLFWIKVREQMRDDLSFSKQLEEIKRLNQSLLDEAGTISLQELHAQMMEVWSAEDAFKAKYPRLFTGEYPEANIDLEEFQEEMVADSAATIGFYSNGLMLYRLFVSGDTVTVKILNGDMEEILDLSAQLPALLNNPDASIQADEAGYRLYSLLLGDLNDDLPDQLHFLSTGPLANLSFAGLRKTELEAAPRYLGTDHALSLQFSIGSMRALRDLELQPEFSCPLGLAPSFDNEFLVPGELRQAGYVLPPLLYSEEELDNLKERSAGRYLYGKRASLENYREYAHDYGIIHLASHAISSQNNGVRSRVFLMDDTGEPAPLYADEIGAETLNADLVVLSACETGGGEEHALEGRVGLTKAYLAAGARSVVSSSWAVDDHATSELMETFYAGIANGQGPGKALQTARVTYRENHPEAPIAKWAAFEAYGGMQPVRWEPEADYTYRWYALFGGLAGLVAAFLGPKLYPAKS